LRDHATVTTTVNPIPASSTVTFNRYSGTGCGGMPVASQTVSVPSGSTSATVQASDLTVTASMVPGLSYNASFASGDTTMVPNAGPSACEPVTVTARPTSAISTALNLVNGDGTETDVTNGTVAVGATLRDHATVTTTVNPIPAGSTVTFRRYSGTGCSGMPVASQTVSVPSGSKSATVQASDLMVTASMIPGLSYNASFASGNTANVPNAGPSACEPVSVTTSGEIFEVTFEQCKYLHVGYNRFTNGAIVYWNVTVNGKGTVASGSFTTIAGGALGSKTFHFLTIPLGTTLPNEASGIQSHAHFHWGTNSSLSVTRDPGC
jgi:hypothetical protein